jgi:hypothetical protein
MNDSLTSCIKCGGQVHIFASQCPKCGYFKPQGVKCNFCGLCFPQEEVYIHEYSGGNDTSTTFYHCHSCMSRYFTPPSGSACPDCHALLQNFHWKDVVESGSSTTCPSCGKPSVFSEKYERCYLCTLPITTFHTRVKWPVNDLLHFAHNFCAATTTKKKDRTGIGKFLYRHFGFDFGLSS